MSSIECSYLYKNNAQANAEIEVLAAYIPEAYLAEARNEEEISVFV